MRHVFDNIKAVLTLDPEVYTADTTGTDAVDTQGYHDAMLLVLTGDVTYTTAAGEGYSVVLYESDDDSTYTSTGISVTANTSNSVGVARITDLNTTRRYIRKLWMGGFGGRPPRQ